MARDRLIEIAIAKWAGRFIVNGVPLSDFQEVTGSLERWDDWCRAWSARAAEHEAAGRQALADGHGISAGEHLGRAAILYHFAKFLFVNDMVQLKEAHGKAVECHTMALPYLDPPGERVEIAYEGKALYGVLRKPRGMDRVGIDRTHGQLRESAPNNEEGADSSAPGRPPVMIMCAGLDSAKEEMGSNEAGFLRRGIATLAFDGPGQGEAEYDFVIRGDYEVAVTAVVDFIETRPDLDAARIGVWGVSLGGYYAPRAAAFEKRIKACIGLSGPYNRHDGWAKSTPMTMAAFRQRSGSATMAEAEEASRQLSLEGVASRITCPLFLVTGDDDTIVPPESTARIAAEASGPTRFLVVERGGHNANNRRHCYDALTADWMAEQLQAAPANGE
jgi:2,6-dihydroxypseudooxynicotine hydrolase